MDINYDRALLLLTVTEKALGHPKLRPIVNAATAELEDFNQACADWLEEKAAEDKAAKAAADEEAAAKNTQLAEEDAANHPDAKPKSDESNGKPQTGMRRAFPRSESEKGSG